MCLHARSRCLALLAQALLVAACETAEGPASHPALAASPLPREAPHRDGEAAPTKKTILLPGGVRRIEIADPQRYWQDEGFVEQSPAVRVSVSSGGRIRTAIYLRVPEGAVVSALPRPDSGASLLFPHGSEADRVTLIPVTEQGVDSGWTIADVRGTRIDAAGQEWFHVYRPLGGQPHSSLVGYEWRRGHDDEQELADTLLAEHIRTHPRALRRRPPGEGYVEGFLYLNDCAWCHVANKPAATDPRERLPPWPTDANSWYTFGAVVSDSAALSSTPSFHDPNFADPFVRATCGVGRARLRGGPRRRYYWCEDGTVPTGTRNVRAGLAERHAYTEAVCRSRRWLYERMDANARNQFESGFADCGIERRP